MKVLNNLSDWGSSVPFIKLGFRVELNIPYIYPFIWLTFMYGVPYYVQARLEACGIHKAPTW